MSPGSEVSEGINIIAQVLRVVITCIIVLFVLYICYALFECLWSYAGGAPLLPRRSF